MTRKLAARPATAPFSEMEEEFFRAGAALEHEDDSGETWADLDRDHQPTSFWSRRRTTPRPATEPSEPIVLRSVPAAPAPAPLAPAAATVAAPIVLVAPPLDPASDDEAGEDEEWQWQLAIARARADE